MTAILIGAILGLIAVMFITYRAPSGKKTWSICKDANGRYSFISWDGNVYAQDFGTYEEAVAQMEATKRWSDEYDNRGAIKKNRNSQFKPIE